MTLPQLIFLLGSIWMFLVLGMAVAAYRENKRKLKQARDAHKAEQTSLDPHELDAIPSSINLRWEDLGLVGGEHPYFDLRAERY
jgi:hypothetical protein